MMVIMDIIKDSYTNVTSKYTRIHNSNSDKSKWRACLDTLQVHQLGVSSKILDTKPCHRGNTVQVYSSSPEPCGGNSFAGTLSFNHANVASVPFSKTVYLGTLNLFPETSNLCSPPGPPKSPILGLRLLISLLLQSKVVNPRTASDESSRIALFDANKVTKF